MLFIFDDSSLHQLQIQLMSSKAQNKTHSKQSDIVNVSTQFSNKLSTLQPFYIFSWWDQTDNFLFPAPGQAGFFFLGRRQETTVRYMDYFADKQKNDSTSQQSHLVSPNKPAAVKRSNEMNRSISETQWLITAAPAERNESTLQTGRWQRAASWKEFPGSSCWSTSTPFNGWKHRLIICMQNVSLC